MLNKEEKYYFIIDYIVSFTASQEMEKFLKNCLYNKIISRNSDLVGIDFEPCNSRRFSMYETLLLIEMSMFRKRIW